MNKDRKVLYSGMQATGNLTLGNYLGARSFTQKGAGIVRPIMLVVMALFVIKLVVDLVVG